FERRKLAQSDYQYKLDDSVSSEIESYLEQASTGSEDEGDLESNESKTSATGQESSDSDNVNRFWLVQFDPGTYDALSAGHEQKYDYWGTRTGSDKVKPNARNLREGDKVAFWQSGTNRGCIGIGTVTQGSNRILIPDLYRKYYKRPDDLPSGPSECVTISYDTVVTSGQIISENALRGQPGFQEALFGTFFSSRQGTFFEISADGWNMLAELVMAAKEETSKSHGSLKKDSKGVHVFTKKKELKKDFIDPTFLENARELLLKKKQIVLFGPPGTSKTYIAQVLAKDVADDRYEICQFHPSLGYEDFVEGIDVVPTEDGTHVLYTPQPRIFRQLCEVASGGSNVVLIIDEINRGDISRIFGELIFGLEKDYRGREISTALSDRLGTLKIPENLLIIGTMNSIDRSIAFVDYALRRRFAFLELLPSSSTLNRYLTAKKADLVFAEALVFFFNVLNSAIRADSSRLGIHHQIGHTMFFETSFDDFKQSWEYTVFPLIEEYMNMVPDQIIEFLTALKTALMKDPRGSLFVPLLDGSLVKYKAK
nr:AAA family ATPase [Candidatus Sigynarchaeota archaeon]